jgi:hypothetical protein
LAALAGALMLAVAGRAADAPTPAAPEDVPLGVELLKNGDLEAPCPDAPPAADKAYWDRAKSEAGHYRWPPGFTFYDRAGSGPVEMDREVSLDGRSSLRLTVKLFGDNGFLFTQPVGLPARQGDTFRLRVYTRHDRPFPAYRSLNVSFRLADNKRANVPFNPPRSFSPVDEWGRIEVEAEAPKDAVALNEVSFKVSNTAMAGRCWWDAMSLIKVRAGGRTAVGEE